MGRTRESGRNGERNAREVFVIDSLQKIAGVGVISGKLVLQGKISPGSCVRATSSVSNTTFPQPVSCLPYLSLL